MRITPMKVKSVMLQHILAWCIFILYTYLTNLLVNLHENFLDVVFANLLSIWSFYAGYFSLKMVFVKKRPLSGICCWLTGLLFLFLLRYMYAFHLLALLDIKPYTTDKGKVIIRDSIFLYMRFLLYSVGFYYARKAVLKERQLRLAEEERMRLEKLNLQSEYAFLRSQINPHFLQNTLNFFYSKSMSVSKQLSDGILLLAEIMRYAQVTDDSSDGKVLLTKEVEHLKNIIKISQMRFSSSLYIQLAITGDITSIRVIPFVLISLAENALKHGELREEMHPVLISLKVDTDRETLYFETSNKKHTGPRELSSGIGLVNIRKRLEWMYGDKFTFLVQDEPEFYNTYLELKYE
ncbi:hypothetical protein F0L74_28890 [Chitinophaga agrisoli]|uniref:Signal transduction histidine kinase internal region domain-containing protein n=1 Tax=Chitinophaga agrisoli TaxID=2607653 RepID=A0A5B2VP76_9BACT|nr:histidine kinase [Chitinophaga agrisoli]KAA2240186.1 hypothetical protein F0L74_28890 [Chitinophaga agrisoli]